jgi:hypothetical protein
MGDANLKTLAGIYVNFYLELLFKYGPSAAIANSAR